jgi:hypothetical protein
MSIGLKQFTPEVIEYLRTNKDEITSELLDALRSTGKEGKQIALDILDIDKDNEQYYLDAFGNRISFNGNRRLKKPFIKLNLSKIHKEEIEKCANDIHYFKDNYVKIKTKAGVNFPDLRPYQDDFINDIIPDENEDNIGLMGRQCCSASTSLEIINNSNKKEMTFEELFNECKNEAKFL